MNFFLTVAVFWCILALAWCLTLFGLPGNWLIVLAAVGAAWFAPGDAGPLVEWSTVFVLVGLAVVGEIVEFAASAAGATRAGGSKRGALLALVGAIGGSIVGALVGLPIPIVGSVAGVLLFASLGAMGGAMLGEEWKGTRDEAQKWQIGQAAFWGRLWGTLAKTAIGAAMAAVAAIAAVV